MSQDVSPLRLNLSDQVLDDCLLLPDVGSEHDGANDEQLSLSRRIVSYAIKATPATAIACWPIAGGINISCF